MRTISISRDFSRFPAGRLQAHSKTSGESFRRRFLEQSVKAEQPVEIDLDGVLGYGSSFLEEAFGGLVRDFHLTTEDFRRLVHIKTMSPSLRNEIEQYVREAAEAQTHISSR